MNKITIRFDGGCRPTNPGNKYGSFEVSLNGRQIILVSRQEFGWGTNNEAEFDAFEAGLKWTTRHLGVAGIDCKGFNLEAFTDSTVVFNRLRRSNPITRQRSHKGFKKSAEARQRMHNCAAACNAYALLFATFEIRWNGREINVSTFGH